MATAYSDTISNFIGEKDSGMLTDEVSRIKMLTMYERRMHPINDVRFDGIATPDGGLLRRCRGGVTRDSINRFGSYDLTEVILSIRKVHSNL